MSRHEVALHNTTDHAMTYHVDYNLCAETIMYPHYHTMMTCVTKKLDVKIESGKEYYNLQPMEGFVFYDRPGTFSVTATTKISNPSHNLVDHTMDAGEINSIHVHY
jgi:flagellar basal body rod protein FlgG